MNESGASSVQEAQKERKKRLKAEVIDYINRNSHQHPFRTGSVWRKNVVEYMVENHDITEQTVVNYLKELVYEGKIVSVDVIEDGKRHIYYDLRFTIPLFVGKFFASMSLPLIMLAYGFSVKSLFVTEIFVVLALIISEAY